jgi:hypothetical protein
MNIKPVYLAVRNVRQLGYHPIHYTHDTDYQIQSRNTIELRQQSSKYSVIYHSLLLFVI